MTELVQFTGGQRTFMAGFGWIEPGQFLDVSPDDAARLVARRDFRRVGEPAEQAKPEAARPGKRGRK